MTFTDKWALRFLDMADLLASWSKDPTTRVGCVVVGRDKEVLSTGFNGLPRSIVDSEARLANREVKYRLVVHAEENALLHAARTGVSLRASFLFTSFAPCTRCAVSIIQTGIVSVTWRRQDMPERWKDDMANAQAVLSEAGIETREIQREPAPSGEADALHRYLEANGPTE